MKTNTLALIISTIILICGSAKAESVSVPLQYKTPAEVLKTLKSSGYSKLLEAVVSEDNKKNAIIINGNDSKAGELKTKIEALDVRPEQLELHFTIKRGSELVGKPMVFTQVGKPCSVSFGEGKEKIEIEIVAEKKP